VFLGDKPFSKAFRNHIAPNSCEGRIGYSNTSRTGSHSCAASASGGGIARMLFPSGAWYRLWKAQTQQSLLQL